MGVLQIIGLILLPFAWMLVAAMNRDHKKQTGVNMPTRSAMKAMRRRARKKGVSEQEYYEGWVARKQKRERVLVGTPGPSPRSSVWAAAIQPPKLPAAVERPRAPPHEAFNIDHLSMMAADYGWTIKKQAFERYYLVGNGKTLVTNPYARPDQISTDFTHRDLEDFLLTC